MEVFEHTVYHTNLYPVQQGIPAKTTIREMTDFITILLMMGVISLPSLEDYWSPGSRIPQISVLMPRYRFKSVRRFVHLDDNDMAATSSDRFFKVRPLLEIIRNICINIEYDNKFSIDETLIPYESTRAGNLRHTWRENLTNGVVFFSWPLQAVLCMIVFLIQKKTTDEIRSVIKDNHESRKLSCLLRQFFLKHLFIKVSQTEHELTEPMNDAQQ